MPGRQNGKREWDVPEITDNHLRRYLLGYLSDSERDSLEADYLADESVFGSLSLVEDELVDDYVRGVLTADEHNRFETSYLRLPGRSEKVAFARELVEALSEKRSAIAYTGPYLPTLWRRLFVLHAVPGWALAGTLLLAIPYCSWTFLKSRELRARLASASEQISELRRQDADLRGLLASAGHEKKIEAPEHSPEAPLSTERFAPTFGLSLLPDASRAIGRPMPKLDLTRASVDLVFDSDDRHMSYVAELQTVGGVKVLDSPSLHRRVAGGHAIVSWQIPVRPLRPGDYVIELKGRTPDGDLEQVQSYSLRIAK